jgi:hypothetical protein
LRFCIHYIRIWTRTQHFEKNLDKDPVQDPDPKDLNAPHFTEDILILYIGIIFDYLIPVIFDYLKLLKSIKYFIFDDVPSYYFQINGHF